MFMSLVGYLSIGKKGLCVYSEITCKSTTIFHLYASVSKNNDV